MMDYMTFSRRATAREEAALLRLRGWPDATAVQLYLPDSPDARPNGMAWVVRVHVGNSDPTYMREDGLFR